MLARASFRPAQHGLLFDAVALTMLKTLVDEGYVSNHAVFAGGFFLTPLGLERGVTTLDALGSKATAYLERASILLKSVSFAAFSAVSRRAHPGMQ